MTEKLLPCPFCGPGQSMVDPWFDDVAKRWAIGCGRCGASSGRSVHAEGSKEAAIKSWNTRDLSGAPAQPARDALVKAEAAFECIRLTLIGHLDEPERTAFWKAVEARNAVRAAIAAQPPAAPVEERKTFAIPPGYEAVRDSEGRATGEVRLHSSAGKESARWTPGDFDNTMDHAARLIFDRLCPGIRMTREDIFNYRCAAEDVFSFFADKYTDEPQALPVTPAMIEAAARAVGYRDYIRGMHHAPEKAEEWSRQHYDMYMGIAETALHAALKEGK